MSNPPAPHTIVPLSTQAETWLTQELQAKGLHLRGCVPVNADTGIPALPGHSQSVLVLVGTVGSAFWSSFSASPEYTDGLPNPLDRWSQLSFQYTRVHGSFHMQQFLSSHETC